MTVRAKFTVSSLTKHHYNAGLTGVKLTCEYDPSIPEDQRFYDATPSGSIEMNVNNPAALAQLTLGAKFYVDFTPITQGAVA